MNCFCFSDVIKEKSLNFKESVSTKTTPVQCTVYLHYHFETQTEFNPLPVQFKSLLPGQEGCVFFSGHLNVCKYHYASVHLGWQAAFKSTTL
jgi:hypothetical protein